MWLNAEGLKINVVSVCAVYEYKDVTAFCMNRAVHDRPNTGHPKILQRLIYGSRNNSVSIVTRLQVGRSTV